MKKRLISLLLILGLLLPCFAFGASVDSIDYDIDGDTVYITVRGESYRPVSIVIEDGNTKYYIDQQETDSGGKAVFITRLEKGKQYNCIVNIAGLKKIGTIFIKDDDPGEPGGPNPPQKPDVAHIYIKGYKGIILSRTQVKLSKGDTVLSLTQSVLSTEGIDYTIRKGYVAGIDGQNEFDKGPDSGWLFKVNGKFPGVGADSTIVRSGDYIEWIYTTDLGEDVGNSYKDKRDESIEIDNTTVEQQEISSTIDSIIKSIIKNAEITEWQAIGMARAGVQVDEKYYKNLEEYIKAQKGNFRKITDCGKIVMAVTALNKDPRNISGYNLIEEIYNNGKMTLQGTNGPAFALLALDTSRYTVPEDAVWSREKLIDWILKQQNDDGGFPLAHGEASDIDITAMALQALSRYRDNPMIKTAVERAVNFLSRNQTNDGGYCSWKDSNSESISQTIIALTALGINPATDYRFVKDGNLISKLLSFKEPDGCFAHREGDGPNDMATEQALVALVAYQRFLEGKNWVYDMTAEKTEQSLDDAVFIDIASASEWAREFIYKAKEYGLMEGKGCNRFEPKQDITRGEVAALLVRLLNDEPNSKAPQVFIDVRPDSWYYGYVMKSYEKGIIFGKSIDKFMPDDYITRQEMAAMLHRALAFEASEDVAVKDIHEASKWAVPSIKAVMKNRIMLGYNDIFSPKQMVTREMAAAVIVRIFEREIAD
jgi:hypothetical protein